jgi:hypothetical protein
MNALAYRDRCSGNNKPKIHDFAERLPELDGVILLRVSLL